MDGDARWAELLNEIAELKKENAILKEKLESLTADASRGGHKSSTALTSDGTSDHGNVTGNAPTAQGKEEDSHSDNDEVSMSLYPVFGHDDKVLSVVAALKKTKRRGRGRKTRKAGKKGKRSASASRTRKKKQRAKRRKARKSQRRPIVFASLNPGHVLESDTLEDVDVSDDVIRRAKLQVQRVVQATGLNVPIVEDSEDIETLVNQAREAMPSSEAFYLVDLGKLVERLELWNTLLPRVEPHYAVKSNPDINILRVLHSLGVGFDCASKAEIEECLSIDVSPEKIVYANPTKGSEHIMYAKEKGIDLMTFDNEDELVKIKSIFPEARVVVRILTDDSHSTMKFGSKFGASLKEVPKLIDKCIELELNLVGLSFHVGSGCFDPVAYSDALRRARAVFDMAEKAGITMSLVDIGGGFPGTDDHVVSFDDMAQVINQELEALFPSDTVRVIAEPGRYFCTQVYTLAVVVTSRRVTWTTPEDEEETAHTEASSPRIKSESDDEEQEQPAKPEKQIMYYLSDGVYGSFNNVIFDHAHPTPHVLSNTLKRHENASGDEEPKLKSRLFGPTCDSIDVIVNDIELPELDVGTWLYFMNMGAYTRAAASSFNGFSPPNARYYVSI